MDLIKRIKLKKRKKKDIREYHQGYADCNSVRDAKEKEREYLFKYELEKKNSEIKELNKTITNITNYVNDINKEILMLKVLLSKIENFVETKQIDANKDALRKLDIIQESEKIIRRIEKKLPEIKE